MKRMRWLLGICILTSICFATSTGNLVYKNSTTYTSDDEFFSTGFVKDDFTEFTIRAAIKVGANSGDYDIVGNYESAGFGFSWSQAGFACSAYSSDKKQYVHARYQLDYDKTYDIACTFDGNDLKLYVDKGMVDTAEVGTFKNNDMQFCILGNPEQDYECHRRVYGNASISDFEIWDKALSEEELFGKIYNQYSISNAILDSNNKIIGACDTIANEEKYSTKNLNVCVEIGSKYEPSYIGKSATLTKSNIISTADCDMVIENGGGIS